MEDLEEFNRLHKECNLIRCNALTNIIKKEVDGKKIDLASASRQLKDYYNTFVSFYQNKIDNFAKKDSLLPDILNGKTTYQDEVKKFQEVLAPTFKRRVGYLFKTPEYDANSFETLKKSLENFDYEIIRSEEFFRSEKEIECRNPKSRARRMKLQGMASLLSLPFLAYSFANPEFISAQNPLSTSEKITLISYFTGLFGFATSFALGFNLFSRGDDYNNLLKSAKNADSFLGKIKPKI